MAGRSEEPYSDSEGGPEFPDHEVSSSFGTKGGGSSVVDEVFEPRLADPARSRAVLIGSASYADFENLPAVAAGVRDLAALFTTAALWGLPAENLTIHLDTSLVEAMAAVRKAAAEAEDAILVYFAGHGVRGPDGELKLAFQDSVVTATETMLPFRYLQEAMAGSRAGTRAMILDCSYAGAADPQRGITHLLAAAGAVIQARAGSGGAHTAFTGELISALAQGVRGGPELLQLDQIGREVTRRCESKALPIPVIVTRDADQRTALFRNQAWFGPISVPSQAGPPSVSQEPPPSHHVPWLHDTPATLDTLQRDALAEILAVRLRQVHEEAPDVSFLVHIDGQWGAGKSTLLNLLARKLHERFLIVSFNAWRHSRVQPTWYPLLTAVRDRVVRDARWFRFLRLRDTWMRIRYAGASWFLPMAVTSAVITAGVAALWASWDPVKSGAVVSAAGPVLAAAGLIWAASRVAGRLFLWNSARGARIFEQSHSDPMGEVAHHFAWLLRRSPRPVVIFIDDLDRCDRETVVETLEVVQNLIRESPTDEHETAASFIVSADGAWLRCAFEGRFEDFKSAIDEPGRPLGYLFQDKLFQLSVPLRFLSAERQSAFVEGLIAGGRVPPDRPANVAEASRRIDESTSEAEIVDVLRDVPDEVRAQVSAQAAVKMAEPDIRRSTEHALLKFAPLLQSNPRGIKRFVNTYSALRTMRTLESIPVDLDTLASWAVIRSRWPQLADELELRPERLDALRTDDGDDEPSAVVAGVPPAEVRALLAALPTPLTGREVRACCGNRPVLDDGVTLVPPTGNVGPATSP